MDRLKLFDTVLRPVTAFLHDALNRVDNDPDLAETARPLIEAIEAVPGSGRVAIYLRGASDTAQLVSGPSFSSVESDMLRSRIDETLSGASLPGLPAIMAVSLDNGPVHRTRLFPLRIAGEEPAAILITVRDPKDEADDTVFSSFLDEITQLAGIVVEDRRLRSKMTDQQTMLSVLLSAAPDAIVRIDRQGTILDFTGSAERVFGWTASDMIGKPLSLLMPEPYASQHDDYLAAFLETGERKLPDFGRTLQARHKSGHVFPVEVALSELPGRDGPEFIGIVRDISRRVAREAEVESLRDALDAAALQSALGEFAATIAHELNQPLTAIANYMDALELRLKSPRDGDLEEALELARKSAAQARLGGQVIARTRRMTLRGDSEMKLDDFHGAVAEAMAMLSHAPSAKGVAIRFSHEGRRDPSLFDRVQVQQILINLVSNALRAMADQQGAELTVVTRQSASVLELIVRDTGPGIADDDKPKIFDRFFRRSRSGMGLGLSIVRRLAQAHGGDITLADAIGGGAEFTLTLPRRVV